MGAGGMAGWLVFLVVFGIVALVTTGVVTARLRSSRPRSELPPPPAERSSVDQAKDALRMRYANGEISREEYLQGKVELED